MIDSFSKGALDKLNSNGINKYYVYRLVDPRTFHTFYVGKGCDNRVFMHAKAATATRQAASSSCSKKVLGR